MASEAEKVPWLPASVPAWPPDDTEESIVGTDLHQTTITNLRLGINEAAHLYRTADQPFPWQAVSQMILLGCRRPDGSIYRTLPDVFVYPHPIDQKRSVFAIDVDGPPVLIIEVLSESTYEVDIDLVRGKGYSYARAGVSEYLTLDPSRAFVSDGGLGRRLVDGAYQPWERDERGYWQSETIDVAIALEGVLATVYTRDGRRLLREGEIEEERARMRDEVERLRRLVDRLQGKDA